MQCYMISFTPWFVQGICLYFIGNFINFTKNVFHKVPKKQKEKKSESRMTKSRQVSSQNFNPT